MKTWYEGHDDAYKKKLSIGEAGWSSPEVTEENYRILKPLLQNHVNCNSVLLELGCGAGDLTEKLLSHTQNITGVDISNTAIQWAKSKTNIPQFLCQNLLNRNAFPENSFDIAVDSCLMHCIIGNDRIEMLKNLHFWLKPTGKFILYTMCGEPEGILKTGFCEKTRNIYHGDIATRHIGLSEDINKEIEYCNFRTIESSLVDNTLVSLHQCR